MVVSKRAIVGMAAAAWLITATALAQGTTASKSGAAEQGSMTVLVPSQGMVPVTSRLPPSTLQGTVVEISCFRSKGAATVAAPDQVACAKAAVAKNTGMLGVLTEGDGLFKLVGPLTANNYAKLAPYIGQKIEVSGAEVVISNNYDYHAFEAQKVGRK